MHEFFGKLSLIFAFFFFLIAKENSVVDSHWTLISGGKLSSLSQRLGIGNSLLFGEKGIRRLETCDLDLTNAK